MIMREQVVEQLSSSTVDALKEEVASKWYFCLTISAGRQKEAVQSWSK